MVDDAVIAPSEENRLKELPIEARHSICLEISKKRRQKVATSIFIPKDLSSRIRYMKLRQRREKNLQISNKNAKMKHDSVTSANTGKKYKKNHLKTNTSLKLQNQQTTNHVYLKHPESYPISNKNVQSTTSDHIRSVLEVLREKTGRNFTTKQMEQVEQQIPLGSDQNLTISFTVEVPEETTLSTSMLTVAETTHNTMSSEAELQHKAQKRSSAEEEHSSGALLPKQELEDLTFYACDKNEYASFYADRSLDEPAYVEPLAHIFKEEPLIEEQVAEVSQPDIPTYYSDWSWNNYCNKAAALDAKTSEASVIPSQQPMNQIYQGTAPLENFNQLQSSIKTSAPLKNFNQVQSSANTSAEANTSSEATSSQYSVLQNMIYLYNQQQESQLGIQQSVQNSSSIKPATIHHLPAKKCEHYLRKQLQHLNNSFDYHLAQNLLEANPSLYATQNVERRAIRSSHAQPTNPALPQAHRAPCLKRTTNSCCCPLHISAATYPGQSLPQQQSNCEPANSQKQHSNTSKTHSACLSSALYDNYFDVVPETAFNIRVPAHYQLQQQMHYQTNCRQNYLYAPSQHFTAHHLDAHRQHGVTQQHYHVPYEQLSVPNQQYIEPQQQRLEATPSYFELPQQHFESQQHLASQQHIASHQLLETQQRLETQPSQLVPQQQRLIAHPPFFEAHSQPYDVQQQHYPLHYQQQQKHQHSHYAYNHTDNISCTSYPARLQRFSQALAHMTSTYFQPPVTDSNYWLQRQLNVLYGQRDASTLLSQHVYQ